MSVDTLFDYLESAEGSKDLDALMDGRLKTSEIEKLCQSHSLAEADAIRVFVVSLCACMQQHSLKELPDAR